MCYTPPDMAKKNTIDVVYQGIAGSYSEASLLEFSSLYAIDVNLVEERGFFEGLFRVIVDKTKLGWVPVSNSHAGTVHQAIDMFLEHDVEIIAEYYFKVKHCLAVLPGTTREDIQAVYSHPQALAQCSNFLTEHSLESLSFHDTAASAEMLSQKQSRAIAAICSRRAAEMYGLEVLQEAIQNDKHNTTRFLLVKRRDTNFEFERDLRTSDNKDEYKSTVIFAAQEETGSLYRCISGFAAAGINMSKIESRKVRGNAEYHYLFYLDYDRRLDDSGSQEALAVLKQHSALVRVLGSYPTFKD